MRTFALLLGAALTLVPALARAESTRTPSSYFTVQLAGGALVPLGDMRTGSEAGLDVAGLFGWTAESGFGLVAGASYAPLRQLGEEGDSHLFSMTAAPRFTLGHGPVRPWVVAGGGLIVERRATAEGMRADTVPSVSGSVGLDLRVFGDGGLAVEGSYTRGLRDAERYDFYSLHAGLVIVL